jgi:hypothetical protein
VLPVSVEPSNRVFGDEWVESDRRVLKPPRGPARFVWFVVTMVAQEDIKEFPFGVLSVHTGTILPVDLPTVTLVD